MTDNNKDKIKIITYENTCICRLSISVDTGKRDELLFSVDYSDSEGSVKLTREEAVNILKDVKKLIKPILCQKVKE